MTTTVTQILGKFVWRELMTSDVEAAKKFYGDAFGWTFKAGTLEGAPAYTEIGTPDGKFVGGIMALPEGQPAPPHWSGYVSVDDVDAAVKRAEAAGGRVYVQPMTIETVGRFAVIADPQGGVTAPFKYDGMESGDEMPGLGAFCWDSLTTSDVAGAKAFYNTVYGWTTEAFGPDEAGVFVFKRPDGNQVASLSTAPEGMPTAWLTYVAVADLEAANVAVEKAGGKVFERRIDIPGIGAMSIVQDPQGAVISAFQGNGEHC